MDVCFANAATMFSHTVLPAPVGTPDVEHVATPPTTVAGQQATISKEGERGTWNKLELRKLRQ